MTDTMDFEGRLLTQRECYQIGYEKGREEALKQALTACRRHMMLSDATAAIFALLGENK